MEQSLQADYKIHLYDPWTGRLQTIITDWATFYLEKQLNGPDTLTLSMYEEDHNVQFFVLDCILEVWRRIPRAGAEWYIESTLLHRTPQHGLNEEGRRIFISYSRGLNDLLHRRFLLYAANSSFVLKTGPGETVMKQLVDENLGPGAASALRKNGSTWNPVIPGFIIEDDAGRGLTWTGSRAWKNLLDVLNDISVETGVDFDVIRDPSNSTGFIFRTYYPQYGVDRSTTLTFSPYLGNMTNITYTLSRTEEVTAVVALGQGEQTSRMVWPQINSEDLAASPWNVIEAVRDARNEPDIEGLQTTASEALKELKAQSNFTFEVLQTSNRLYGQNGDYWFGDIVQAEYAISVIRKLVGVNINMTRGVEELTFDLSEFPIRN